MSTLTVADGAGVVASEITGEGEKIGGTVAVVRDNCISLELETGRGRSAK
jgi:hypothetical protein